MDKFEKYLDKAKDLAGDAGDMAKHFAGEVVSKAKELTEEGGKVREMAKNAKEQTAAMTFGAREKVNGILQDARAVKEIKLAVAELEAFPDDGSILYKMDLEAIINDLSKLSLFVSDSRLDDGSVEEEIRKVMSKIEPAVSAASIDPAASASDTEPEGTPDIEADEAAQQPTSEPLTGETLTDEQLLIEKAKAIAYGACTRALEALKA